MAQPTTTPGLNPSPPEPALPRRDDPPTLPEEVRKFAEEHGLTAYLADLLSVAREIVPDRPITVRLDCDPSIPDDWYITLRVDVGDMTAEQIYAAHIRWSHAVIARCPAPHRHFFYFGL